jgi:hypothetical protein
MTVSLTNIPQQCAYQSHALSAHTLQLNEQFFAPISLLPPPHFLSEARTFT